MGAVGYAVLLLVAIVWGIPHIEEDLTASAEQAVERRGVLGLDIDFDGRIAVVSRVDESGTDRVDIETAIGNVDGVRRIRMRSAGPNVEIASVRPTTTIAEPSTTVNTSPVPTRPSAISFERDVDDHVVLTGQVATDRQRDELFDAADRVGFSRIADRLEVSEAVIVDDERHQAMSALLSAVSLHVLPASLVLDGDTLVITGESGSPDVVDRLAAPLDRLREVGVEITFDVVAVTEDEQILRLREELMQILSLAARIEPERSNFDAESSDLDLADEVVLERVGQAMRRFPLPSVAIIGHTDAAGPADENLDLSRLRARVVFDFLVREQKIDGERLRLDGRGESEPIASNDTADGRRMNRRVQFVVEKKES